MQASNWPASATPPAQEAAAALKATGLKVCGAHVGIHEFQTDLKGTLAKYGAVGCQNVIVPWLPQELREDVTGWKAFAKLLNKLGKQVERGLQARLPQPLV